ncbi:hypothetical protein AAK894_08060 [Lachnospiraceae bacterium 46-61]
MKKVIALMVAMFTVSSCFSVSAFAEETEEIAVEATEEIAMENVEEIAVEYTEELEEAELQEPRASEYFASYYYDLEPDDEVGYLYFESLVARTSSAEKIRISVQIQQFNGGWEDYAGEFIGTGSTPSYAFEDRVKVDRGEKYRALFTFEALVNGKVVETKYGSTSGFYAP